MQDKRKRPKILIVDDDRVTIAELNLALEAEYQVLFAFDGQNGLNIATRTLPDLIILDVNMPGMDGFNVCRALKREQLLSDIPVIFLTVMGEETDEAKGLELGAVDYIAKPIISSLVKLRVRNHLELKLQRDVLDNLSFIDGLTGLNNRRMFDDRLQTEWRRALRSGSWLSLIMIDIDNFKLYNDTYGHLAGDDCLRGVARTLEQTLHRAEDFIARYGGEEFVCILPQIRGDELESMAEKLRLNVEKLKIPHTEAKGIPHVTVSLGVASQLPNPTASPQTLVAAADQLLYLAKSLGRNRFSVCPSPA